MFMHAIAKALIPTDIHSLLCFLILDYVRHWLAASTLFLT